MPWPVGHIGHLRVGSSHISVLLVDPRVGVLVPHDPLLPPPNPDEKWAVNLSGSSTWAVKVVVLPCRSHEEKLNMGHQVESVVHPARPPGATLVFTGQPSGAGLGAGA